MGNKIDDIPGYVMQIIAGFDDEGRIGMKSKFIEVLAAMEKDPAISLDYLLKTFDDPRMKESIVQLHKLGATDPTSFDRVKEEFLTKISVGYLGRDGRQILGITSKRFRDSLFGYNRERTIAHQLLLSVVYGMESEEVNIRVEPSHTAGLFPSHLYAKTLLTKSPEFLSMRADVTDWAGRTFNNVTAFEYALWAKDFKMLAMMLACIPRTPEGDAIREDLHSQYQKFKIPVSEGGGLKYTHKYDRPNLNDHGIPDGTSVEVTQVKTEHHFDFKPLIQAYKDYEEQFENLTLDERDTFWVRMIGMLQHQLPVHVLQLLCSNSAHPFKLAIQSETTKRSIFCTHWSQPDKELSLFTTLSSNNSALYVGNTGSPQLTKGLAQGWSVYEKENISHMSRVSTAAVESLIEQQLSQAQHGSLSQQTNGRQREEFPFLSKITSNVSIHTFGPPFESRFRSTPVSVGVIKRIELKEETPESGRALRRSVTIHEQSSFHPNILQMLAAVRQGRVVKIYTHLVDKGSLRRLMMNNSISRDSVVDFLMAVTYQVLNALLFLDKKLKTSHGDLNANHILIGSDGLVRLCGFGASGRVPSHHLSDMKLLSDVLLCYAPNNGNDSKVLREFATFLAFSSAEDALKHEAMRQYNCAFPVSEALTQDGIKGGDLGEIYGWWRAFHELHPNGGHRHRVRGEMRKQLLQMESGAIAVVQRAVEKTENLLDEENMAGPLCQDSCRL